MGRLDDNPHQPSQFLSVEEASKDVPHLNQIPPFSNKESWWFHPDRDAEGTLSFIKIITCPCHEQCDGYLMHHLTQSTKHSLSENDAYNEILRGIASGDIKFEVCAYTAESRQLYRDDVRLAIENDKKRKTTSSSHDEGKRGRSHKDDRAQGAGGKAEA